MEGWKEERKKSLMLRAEQRGDVQARLQSVADNPSHQENQDASGLQKDPSVRDATKNRRVLLSVGRGLWVSGLEQLSLPRREKCQHKGQAQPLFSEWQADAQRE